MNNLRLILIIFLLSIVNLIGLKSRASESKCDALLAEIDQLNQSISAMEMSERENPALTVALKKTLEKKVKEYQISSGQNLPKENDQRNEVGVFNRTSQAAEKIAATLTESPALKKALEPLQPERKLETYFDQIYQTKHALSRHGEYLALIGSQVDDLIIKDTRNGETILSFNRLRFDLTNLKFSQTEKKLYAFHRESSEVLEVDFSKKGDSRFFRYSAPFGYIKSVFQQLDGEGKWAVIRAYDFLAREQLLSFSLEDKSRVLWKYPLSGFVSIYPDPRGKYLCVNSETALTFLDSQTGQPILEFQKKDKFTVSSIRYSPNGQFVALGLFSDLNQGAEIMMGAKPAITIPPGGGHHMAVIDLHSGNTVHSNLYPGIVSPAYFSYDENLMALIVDNHVHILDLDSPGSNFIHSQLVKDQVLIAYTIGRIVSELKSVDTQKSPNLLTAQPSSGGAPHTINISDVVVEVSGDGQHFLTVKRIDDQAATYSIVDMHD